MVSKAHVLSANSPDFSDIMTRHASGVPVKSNIRDSNQCIGPKFCDTVNSKQCVTIVDWSIYSQRCI